MTNKWLLVLACLAFCLPNAQEADAAPTSRPTSRPVSSTPPPSTRQPTKQRPTARTTTTTTKTKKPPAARPKTASKDPKKAMKNKRLRRGLGYIRKLLKAFLHQHGRDPNNPWLLSHSLLAFGKDLKLADGTYAIDRIVSGYLRFRKVGGKDVPYFPQGNHRNRIEPHPFMHLKTFLEQGVPLTRKFKVGKRTITLQQILNGAIGTFPFNPKGKDFSPMAWRLSLLYGRTPKKDGWLWTNYKGERINFFNIIFRAFKYANNQSNFLRILQRRGVKVIPKRKQYIYSEPCGGFHLLQAVMQWMGHPQFKRHTKDALNEHINLIFYRISGEMKLYLSMFKRYQRNPGYRFIVLLQQLKFLGHALETITKLHNWGLFTPNAEQKRAIRSSVRMLMITVMLIDRLGFMRGIQKLKQSAYQFYLDLLGDSAHALHALTMIEKTTLFDL